MAKKPRISHTQPATATPPPTATDSADEPTAVDAKAADNADQPPVQHRWLQYLDTYCNNRAAFKFHKRSQYQLLQYTYNKQLLPKSHFGMFVQYIGAIKGKSRQVLIDEANKKIELFESDKFEDEHAARRDYKRAKQIVSVLVV